MQKELPKRKPTRLQGFDYNVSGAYFITLCTLNREHILSRIIRKKQQSYESQHVGVGVPDDPKTDEYFYLELLPFGEIADKYIKQLNEYYDDIDVSQYVIMPNHIHIMLVVYANKELNIKNGSSRFMENGSTRFMENGSSRFMENGSSRFMENGSSRFMENGSSRTPTPTTVSRQNSVVSRFVSTFKRFCNKEYGYNIWQRYFNDHIIRNQEDYKKHLNYIYENPMRWEYDELYLHEKI